MIKVERFSPGGWAIGYVGEYRFHAQFQRDHATNSEWELADSKISKLRLQNRKGIVFNWDCGADVEATSEEVEDAVVELCSELHLLLRYRPGDRIRLLSMDDPDPVPAGSLGTVRAVRFRDGRLQVDVQWNNGRRLMLSVPPDRIVLEPPAANDTK